MLLTRTSRCVQAEVLAPHMAPHNVANLAWAYAVRSRYSPTLWDALVERVGAISGQLEPQHVSVIAWAAAKLGHKHEGLMAALGEQAVQLQLEGFQPHNLVSTKCVSSDQPVTAMV